MADFGKKEEFIMRTAHCAAADIPRVFQGLCEQLQSDFSDIAEMVDIQQNVVFVQSPPMAILSVLFRFTRK